LYNKGTDQSQGVEIEYDDANDIDEEDMENEGDDEALVVDGQVLDKTNEATPVLELPSHSFESYTVCISDSWVTFVWWKVPARYYRAMV